MDEEYGILATQEHWLYTFEQAQMDKLLPNLHHHVRSVDEYHPIFNAGRLAGMGGVATFWTRSLNQFAHKSDEGNERILVTIFNIRDNPVCLINCYLPSGTQAETIVRFREEMGCLQSLLQKYSSSHEILLLGDLNEDIHGHNLSKERILKDLISTNDLSDFGRGIPITY